MNKTRNYQALLRDIVRTAEEDAQGQGQEAIQAKQWLNSLDPIHRKMAGIESAPQPAATNEKQDWFSRRSKN